MNNFVQVAMPCTDTCAVKDGIYLLGRFAKKQFNSFWLGAFVRFDNLNQAAFEDSPLVATHRYHLVGIAATWVLSRSEEQVYTP